MLDKKNTSKLECKLNRYFLPLTAQIELLILASILFFGVSLIFVQILMGIHEDAQAYLNKAIQYEGVFQQDEHIKAVPTLQGR